MAGAAWTAPIVYGSFASPAAAASDNGGGGGGGGNPEPVELVDTSTPGTGSVTIPAGRQVDFIIIGGGGGGGGYNSYIGGSGTTVTGRINAHDSDYVLSYHVASGGGGGGAYHDNQTAVLGGTAGSGYRTGGPGGATGLVNTGTGGGPGGGGGGGGASAIYNTDTGIKIEVIAPGGGGSGGGSWENLKIGAKTGGASSGALNVAGTNGNNPGTGSGSNGGTGGPVPPATTAAGGTASGGNVGGDGTTSTGGGGGGGFKDGGGGGGGGGGYVGGGGGAGDQLRWPGASGGSGSATAAAADGFSVAPSAAPADTTATDQRISPLAATTPGRCGDGTNNGTGNDQPGGAGGNGRVKITII